MTKLDRSASLSIDLQVADRVRVELEAAPGEVIALVGPNGAGKSSLIGALAGLVPATGSAELDGVDLLALPAQERRVGLAPQAGLLFPHLTAVANVAYGLRARGQRRDLAHALARDWLTRFEVADLADRRPGELSGGQAQRVVLARALASDPGLLLLDEPTAGLDLTTAASLRVQLARHLSGFTGVTLLATHTASDALTLADRIVVLDQGAVVQDDTPDRVRERPRTPHVARLMGLNLVTHGGESLSFAPNSVVVSVAPPQGSPQLRWAGTVAELAPWGDSVRVTVATEVGHVLADVTSAAVADLALLPGREVWLAVKRTAVQD